MSLRYRPSAYIPQITYLNSVVMPDDAEDSNDDEEGDENEEENSLDEEEADEDEE